MTSRKSVLSLAVAAALSAASGSTLATNGMNLEGYGAEAFAMGGASMAYENGTAASMNNPATLALMDEGNRIDVALGFLGPDVSVDIPGMPTADSGGDSYYMPAFGWARKRERLVYGVAIFAQGGMGTEYGKNSVLAMGTGEDVRSELGVGRFMVPLAYQVNDKLTVGGSLDLVWAGLDLKMAMPLSQAGQMVDPGNPGTLAPMLGMLPGNSVTRFDFSDSNDYTGEAMGTGWAGKLGLTYKVNEQLTVGAVYHSETDLDDLDTDDATISAYNPMDGTQLMEMHGDIEVQDFQWPATFAVGMAFKATPQWMFAADIKRIKWSDVMDKFRMEFKSDMGNLRVALPQDWDDQTAVQLGAAYAVNDKLTVRAGANLSDNPIPDTFVNALFPAIVENHYTVGFGYRFNERQAVDFGLSYAPEVEVTNPGNAAAGIPPTEISHSQTSWQLLYSHRF